MVVHIFEDGCESDTQERHIFPCHAVPHDLHLLSFGVGDDLSGHVNLVRHVEDVQAKVVSEVGVVKLFIGSQTKFDDVFDFLPGDLTNLLITPGTLLIISSTSIWQ